MAKYLVALIVLFAAPCAFAQTLKADQLHSHCTHVQKGAIGEHFNAASANICTTYMGSFFDTMIIVNKLSGQQQFCVPPSLPTTQNTLILDAWIGDNKTLAADTTAAVALFAAFKKAFPCTPQAQ